MKFNYSKGTDQNVVLEAGDYRTMISKAEIISIQGVEKLKVDFSLENGDIRSEWIRLETWIPLFTDLLEASGQEFNVEGGEFDTDYLVGIEGTLKMVENKGKGKHEGKTFINADRFTKAEAKKK